MSASRDPLQTLHEHAAFVRAVARRLVGDPSDVDDLVQETWVRALAPRRTAIGSLRSWLATIVRSVAIDRRRAEAARRAREQEFARQRDDARAPTTADDTFGFDALTSALQALPADYRRVLQLRYHAQLSPSAIANELGVPLATAKSRLQRALNLLRDDLNARHGGDRPWRPALALGLQHEAALAGGPGLALATGAIMSKTWIAVAAVVTAALLCLPFLSNEPAAPPGPNRAQDIASEARSAVATGGAVGSPANAADDPAATSLAREQATTNKAQLPAEALRGRVVYGATGQGVPFLRVQVRADGRAESLRTDFDGHFASAQNWPTNVEVAIAGSNAPLDAEAEQVEPAVPSNEARTGEAPAVVDVPLLPTMATKFVGSQAEQPPMFAPANQEQPVARYARLDTIGRREDGAWHIEVQLGPTFLLRPTPEEALTATRLFAQIEPLLTAAGTRWPAHLRAGEAFAPVPGSRDLWWLRTPPMQDGFGKKALLLVHGEDGQWSGELQNVGSEGVVGPLDLALTRHGKLEVVVVDTVGTPRRASHVLLTSGSGVTMRRLGATTDDQGRFTLPLVPPGEATVRIAAEDIEPMQTTVHVRAGETTKSTIVVRVRPAGGKLAGTITTASGREFASISVHLTSRQDHTIWRTADIEWKAIDGKQVAQFAFDDVPLLECDLQLNTFAPCRVPVRRLRATPPTATLRFHVDDAVEDRPVAIVVTQADGTPCPNWTLRCVGDDGWQTSVSAHALVDGRARLPRLPGNWRLQGPGLRCLQGRIEGIGERLELRAQPGWSALVSGMDIANFFPARGAAVFVDGKPVGALDDDGELWLDLPATPKTITFDPLHWRVYRDAGHRSDVDADGTLHHDGGAADLFAVYLQRMR